MKLYNQLLQRSIFPLVDTVQARKVWQAYRETQQTETWSEDQLRELQQEKLTKLIDHCASNVPYYQALFKKHKLTPKDIRTIADLEKIPISTKKDLRHAGLEKTVARNKAEFQSYPDSTSGSTGEPFRFLGEYPVRDKSTAYTLRGWTWTGYTIGDPVISLWGWHPSNLANDIYNGLMRNTFLSAYDLDAKLDSYVSIIERRRPVLLTAYVSALVKFCRMIEARGITLSVPYVVTTSEMLYPENRELIKTVLGAEVFDRYGSREMGSLAQECEAHNGVHINEESFIVQYEKAPNMPGDHLIVTNLEKYAMPLLRYEMGDLGNSAEKRCKCGRAHSKIGELFGRVNDFVTLPSGKLIAHMYFSWSLEQYGDFITRYQAQYHNKSHKFVIKIIPSKNFPKTEQKKLIDNLHGEIDAEIPITIDIVDSIPLTKAGKLQRVLEVNN